MKFFSMQKTIPVLIAITVLVISMASIQKVQADLQTGDTIPVCCTWDEHLLKNDGGHNKIQLSYKISGGTQDLRDAAQMGIDNWNNAMANKKGIDNFLVENTAKGKDGKSDITIKISRGGGPIAGFTSRHFDHGTNLVSSVNINISGKFVGTSVVDDVEEIVTHELGHAFSLGHTEPDDLMSPTVNGHKTITDCHVDGVAFANFWAFNPVANLDTATPDPIESQNFTCQ